VPRKTGTRRSRKSSIRKISVPKPREPAERETIISYNAESDEATVYTWDDSIHTYMQKIGVEPVEIYTNGSKQVAWLYKVPKQWAVVKRPRRTKKDGESVE
jgi:hypothetical protein